MRAVAGILRMGRGHFSVGSPAHPMPQRTPRAKWRADPRREAARGGADARRVVGRMILEALSGRGAGGSCHPRWGYRCRPLRASPLTPREGVCRARDQNGTCLGCGGSHGGARRRHTRARADALKASARRAPPSTGRGKPCSPIADPDRWKLRLNPDQARRRHCSPPLPRAAGSVLARDTLGRPIASSMKHHSPHARTYPLQEQRIHGRQPGRTVSGVIALSSSPRSLLWFCR